MGAEYGGNVIYFGAKVFKTHNGSMQFNEDKTDSLEVNIRL